MTLNVRSAWRQCVMNMTVILTFPLTTRNANDAGYLIVEHVRSLIIATDALVILMDRNIVIEVVIAIEVVITYVVIIVMGLRYAVFLTIHVICAKTDIT